MSHNDSIMIHMLNDKMQKPEIIGEYAPEGDVLICPRNSEEMCEYLEEKQYHGMPYGFSALKIDGITTPTQYLLKANNWTVQKIPSIFFWECMALMSMYLE